MDLYSYCGKCNLAGARIREVREKRSLSQETLAKRLQLEGMEINQKAVSRIETGARVLPDYELLFFAKVLNVSILWLLGEEEAKE